MAGEKRKARGADAEPCNEPGSNPHLDSHPVAEASNGVEKETEKLSAAQVAREAGNVAYKQGDYLTAFQVHC